MAMDLLGRPYAGHDAAASHRGGSAAVSIALHCTVLLALLAAFHGATEETTSKSASAIVPDRIIWMPQPQTGGGTFGAGDHAIQPPRRVQAIGRDAASVPAPAEVSPQITNNAPDDTPSIPARPMGNAFVALPGAIDGQSASDALGTGTTQGAGGDTPGNGFFGEGAASGAGVTTPTLIRRVTPRYTADAMRLRIQGSVWVECVVLADGTVGDARIMRSLDPRFGLDEEALLAAKQWRFRPGTLNGKPVPVVVSIELMFSVR